MRALFFALLLSGCTSAEVMCAAVTDKLEQCGLPVAGFDCATIDYATLSDLSGRLKGGACTVTSDDDAVDPRLCALAGWACPSSPTPVVTTTSTVNPIVLVSGIDDSPVFDWNPSIAAALGAAGVEAHHITVAAWLPTAARAADLASSLQTLSLGLGGKKVNLVCYAVAGLDCRFLVSPKGLYEKDEATRQLVIAGIASITTISTPHRGTRVADAAIVALQSSTVTDVLQTLFGVTATETIPDDATLVQTLNGLTLDALEAFDRNTPDEPSIYGQSFAGISTPFGQVAAQEESDAQRLCVDSMGQPAYQRHDGTVDALGPILLLSAPFSHTARDGHGSVVTTPSDGMIPLASASWANFRGCIPADHYDVIGQIGDRTRDPLTGFDARRFYVWLASDLGARGL